MKELLVVCVLASFRVLVHSTSQKKIGAGSCNLSTVWSIEHWLRHEAFLFDENPGFKGSVTSVELFTRVDFATIYSMCALLKVAENSAFLIALYTNEDHRSKGYAREALSLASNLLRAHRITATVPLHTCINAVILQPFYEKLLRTQGWPVHRISNHSKDPVHVHFDPSLLPDADALVFNPREGIVADSVLWNMVRGSPCLVVGLCLTLDIRKRTANNPKGYVWTADNVGRAFAVALMRRYGSTVVLDLSRSMGEPGGLRNSQYRAIRAPEVEGLDWKGAADCEMARAEKFLLNPERACTRSQKPIDVKESITFLPWLQTIDAVAQRETIDGRLFTLIPNFYSIDPDHRCYPNFKYPKGHHFG
jgi:hypothetical protein